MATELYAGSIGDWDTEPSMAREIEDALIALLGPLPSSPDGVVDERRKLFIAIANGVIKHLQKHQAAVAITLDGGGNHITTINVRP